LDENQVQLVFKTRHNGWLDIEWGGPRTQKQPGGNTGQ
jgi:hypothetical protein